MMAAPARKRFLVVLVIIAAAARAVTLQWLHVVTWDEIEFFRATDWVRQGLVPYRDFWEHHTPLQWFLFAPVAALTSSPGVSAVVLMRWAQVPLWIAAFWLVSIWMRDAGVSAVGRRSAILLALCSTMLMLAVVEYRVDAVGCVLYVAALVCLQRLERGGRYGFAAGVSLCLAGFANLRLGPLLALTVLVARVVRPRNRRWQGQKNANWAFAGILVTLALAALYFFATKSAFAAYRHLWVENYLADRISPDTPWILPHRLLGPFGIRIIDTSTDVVVVRPVFDPQSIDFASIVVLVIGAVGVVRVLFSRFRTPDDWFVLGFLQVSSFFFIAAMKYIYHYHFEIVILLMLPFVGAEIDRLLQRDRWQIVAAGLLLASATSLFASLFRGKEGDMAYEDFIMKEVDRRTPAGSTVFDGVGRALRRRPAYRYWFLPTLVKNLVEYHRFEPYSLLQMSQDPPAAIITDYRAYLWLEGDAALAAFATTHYLPVWCGLWLPGMNGVLTPAKPAAEWIVPESGTYRVYASDQLARHPWFHTPLKVGSFPSTTRIEVALVGFPPPSLLPMSWFVDGHPVQPDALQLLRKQHLRVVSNSRVALAVMIVPAGTTELFRQPPPNVTIDGGLPPVTHIPHVPHIQ